MCQRWAANAIKIKASRLHCPLRQHWRPGGNGKETLSRPRWLPFFSFYSIHTPSVRLFHQHKMQKKKNVLRPASRCGYLSSGSQVNEPIKISNFFFLRKISFVCKQNTTNVVSGSEASWGSGTLRFCGGCRTRAHKNIPFTHTHTDVATGKYWPAEFCIDKRALCLIFQSAQPTRHLTAVQTSSVSSRFFTCETFFFFFFRVNGRFLCAHTAVCLFPQTGQLYVMTVIPFCYVG